MEKSGFLTKLTQIVLNNLNNEQFGVEDLSEAYGLSRSQLHKKLKKQTGKSVSQFIREVRLEEAKKLLKQEDFTASEVAYQVGFSSATYFNTRFKDYFGYPPGEVKVRASYGNTNSENSSNATIRTNLPKTPNWQKWAVAFLGLVLLVTAGVFFFKNNKNTEDSSDVSNQALLADSISNEKTIAVMPLKNWSGDPDLEYISNGMTDAIINKLSQLQNIDRVLPFTTTLAYKETGLSTPELAERLGVNYILEGSFQNFADDFRINVRLVDAFSDKSDWSESFEGPWKITEIFNIQSNIAESVANRLKVQILDEEYEILQKAPTLNQEAYDYFLRADYTMLKLDSNSIENSKQLYKKAIALDSTFVDAYLRLGTTWMLSGVVWGIHSEQYAWSRAKEYYKKAGAIKGISDYNKVRITNEYDSGSYFFEWNFEAGKKNYDYYFFRDADSNTPRSTIVTPTHPNLAVDFAKHNGKFEEALYILKQITNNETTSLAGIKVTEALMETFLGKNEKVIKQLETDDELFDDHMYYLMESAQIYYYLKEHKKFDKNLTKLMQQFKDRSPRILFLNAINENLKGNTNKENDFVRALLEKYNENAPGSPTWFTALYYAHLNNEKKCLEWLTKCYERQEVEMVWLRSEPLLQFVNCSPQYLELYEDVGFLVEPPCKPESDTLKKIELSNE